jgi:hypothetical protein
VVAVVKDTMRVYLPVGAFQLRRSLLAFGLDLPVMSVHGAGAYHDATASPAWNQTQQPTFYGCIRLGSAAYLL